MTKRKQAEGSVIIVGAIAGLIAAGAMALAATVAPTSGPAQDGSPAWHLQVGGRAAAAAGGSAAGGRGTSGGGGRAAGGRGRGAAPAADAADVSGRVPGCAHTTICGYRGASSRPPTGKVEWDQNLGYTITYPYQVPSATGGIPSVSLDSHGNLWAIQRSPAGSPQVYEFDKDYKLIRTIGDDLIGRQEKGHGIAVDGQDNAWFSDTNGSGVMKLSPEGKVLLTLGIRGKRGDWDEAKGQRLLWQPVSFAFGANNDVYIGGGHANESPNDVGSDDPANNIGAARILHLTTDGKFIGQWFGDEAGQGKFDSAHGLAVDPATGDVWIGDREQYRIVIYSGDGTFLRTIQMRNLTCGIAFDPAGNPWVSSGQDGQLLRIDRNGKVLGAIGGGMGNEPGQFGEANYFAFDKQNNIYVGDTLVAHITKINAPGKK
jgi:hypothetical protein